MRVNEHSSLKLIQCSQRKGPVKKWSASIGALFVKGVMTYHKINNMWISHTIFAAISILLATKKIKSLYILSIMPIKKAKKKHVSIQALPRTAFRSSPRCLRSTGTSTSKRLRKTPRTDAKKCLGTVRVGQDGKYLYIALPHRQKNPRYKTSKTPALGTHLTARWEKVYDKRTGKPLKVSDLPAATFSLLS